MAKMQDRNWLLIITGFLFFSILFALIVNLRERGKEERCFSNGKYYRVGDVIDGDCYCDDSKKVICEGDLSSMPHSEYSSEGLNFTYRYLNLLDKSQPDYGRVNPGDIDYNGQNLSITFEREALCSSNEEAPIQTGYYELEGDILTLLTLTNKDTAMYTRPCLISNEYVISNIHIPNTDSFSIFYRNEENKVFDLRVCSYNGGLYGSGDVFESTNKGEICSCKLGVIECK